MISMIFLWDINRCFRKPLTQFLRCILWPIWKEYPLRIEIDIKFDFKLWYPRQFFIRLQLDCACTCTPCMYCDVSSLDAMLLLDKQGTSRSPIVTLRSLRNGNHRRGRDSRDDGDSCTWLTLHYSRVQSWESFRAARERRFVRLSGGRKHAASRKGRNTREKLLGGNNRVMCRLNCLGPNEQGNRRRIWCHVTFPYIPRRDASRVFWTTLFRARANLSKASGFLSIYRSDFRSSYRAW